jgi:hypothetical protein
VGDAEVLEAATYVGNDAVDLGVGTRGRDVDGPRRERVAETVERLRGAQDLDEMPMLG